MVRMDEFVHQARLAHPRFADDRRHLTTTLAGKLLRAVQLLQLEVAADEARQATPGGGLEPCSRGAGARHLVNRYRIGESLDRHRAEGLHGDVAFRLLHSVGRCKYRTGLRHLFHASRQVRCLAHDGVVHMQIVADGTDDDLP